jgi:hypothetical protein
MPFPLIAALIGAAGSLGAAAMGARASRRAAGAVENTQRENRALAEETTTEALSEYDTVLDQVLGAQQPYSQAGQAGLSEYLASLGLGTPDQNAGALARFRDSPGYQFQMDQGVSALDRSAAARGGLYSGAQGQALTQFGQGLADQTFNNRLSHLAGLAGLGERTASNEAGYRLGVAGNRAGLRMGGLEAVTGANTNIGQAQATGITGAANQWTGAFSNIGQMLAYGGSQGFSTPLYDAWRARQNPTMPVTPA